MKYIVKKLDDRTGLTLTELLVSSMLMGIVMVGAAGYGATIKRMYDTNDKQTILAMQAAAAMAYIERTIVTTTGYQDLVTGSTFSYNSSAAAPRAYWSFRTDPLITPDTWTDDVWSIIYKPTAGDPEQYDIYACTQPLGVGPGLGPVPDVTSAPCGANRKRLIANRVQTFNIIGVLNTSPSVLDQHLEVSIKVSYDPSNEGVVGADDPFDDPAFSIRTRINVPAHSWN